MTTPEAYIKFSREVFTDDGEVTNDSTVGRCATAVTGRICPRRPDDVIVPSIVDPG